MKKIFIFLVLTTVYSFGQDILSEELLLKNGSIELPGTLSYPESPSAIPLLIFIHGSGNIDRNGNQGAMVQGNYIKMLADSLNSKGFGFYRYDKRTANPENIKRQPSIVFTDFVADAKTAIDHFTKDARFSSIHLIGHSQGALVAMLSTNEKVSSYTSLAGAANSIDKIVIQQVKQQDSTLARMAAKHFEELKTTDTIAQVHPFLLSIFAPQNQKFFKDWATYQPTERIKTLTVPILIVNGDKDLQVSVEEAKMLKAAAPEAQMEIIPQMNHVLKQVEKDEDNLKTYQDPSYPISSFLINILTQFITTNG